MAGRRSSPRVCGAMGDGDVCGRPMYHEGSHVGSYTGTSWAADPSQRSQRARHDRSAAGSLADDERQSRARRAPAPHVKPRPHEQPQLAPNWFFRDPKRARDIDIPPRPHKRQDRE